MNLKKVLMPLLFMCIVSLILSACSNKRDFEYITDVIGYENIGMNADKIDVEFKNDSQEEFLFTIDDKLIVDEIVEIVLTTKLINRGNESIDFDKEIYIKIWTSEKAYRLNVCGIIFNKELYAFTTRDLENKVMSIIKEQNGFDITVSTQYESVNTWQKDKNYPNTRVIQSYEDYNIYRQFNKAVSINYEENFFKNYFLVLIELETTNGAQSYFVSKVILKNRQLIIYINQEYVPDVGGATVMGEYIAFVEIRKTISMSDKNIIVNLN